MLQPSPWLQGKPQRPKRRVNLTSKTLIPVYLALVVSWFVFSLVTQPHFHPISEICQDYQLQKTLYAATPVNSECDRAITQSEASYLAAYPIVPNHQATFKYLGFVAVAGVVLVTLRTGVVGQIRQISRLRLPES